MKYNKGVEFEKLHAFKDYRQDNPETKIDFKQYSVVEKIKSTGAKGTPILDASKPDIQDFSFSDEHINVADHQRGISKEEAIGFTNNIIFSLKQRKGQREIFYSKEGAVCVDFKGKTIVTAFKSNEYDDTIKTIISEVLRNGRK